MPFELGKNFQTSLVATAPSPASSGTSLVVTAGEGARFDSPPFNAIVCPADSQPTSANAEIVRVTAKSTDTFTISRAQESSSARSIAVGDRIFVGPTVNSFTNIANTTDLLSAGLTGKADKTAVNNGQAGMYCPSLPLGRAAVALAASRAYFGRVVPVRDMTITAIAFFVSTLGADTAVTVGIYTYSGSTLSRVAVSNATTGVLNSTGVKSVSLTASYAMTAGTTYYAAISCDTGTTAQVVMSGFGANSAANLFGTALGSAEMVYKASSHPLGTPVTSLATDGSAMPTLALKE